MDESRFFASDPPVILQQRYHLAAILGKGSLGMLQRLRQGCAALAARHLLPALGLLATLRSDSLFRLGPGALPSVESAVQQIAELGIR